MKKYSPVFFVFFLFGTIATYSESISLCDAIITTIEINDGIKVQREK